MSFVSKRFTLHRGWPVINQMPLFNVGLRREEGHEVTAWCRPWHCAWHNVDEPLPAYLVCGECLHAYASPSDLMARYLQNMEDLNGSRPFYVPTVANIPTCPYCGHNF